MSAAATPPPASRLRNLVRVAVIILVCVSAALLLSVDAVYQGLQRLLSTAEPLITGHPLLGAGVFVVFSAISAILAFFSSALLVPAAVFAWGSTLTACLLWLGWLLGGMLTYALGRGLRRPAGRDRASPGRFAAYLARVPKDVGFSLLLLWQLALPSEIPGYLCGYLGVPFRRYVAALAIAELPYAVGAVWLGESVVDRKLGLLLALGVVGATLGLVIVRMLQARLDKVQH